MTEQEANRLANATFVVGFIIGAGIFGFTAASIATGVCNKGWQSECISRGVAEYDAKTAQFKWLVEPKGE